MPHVSATTRLTLPVAAAMRGTADDKILREVRNAVQGEYDILGELGRGAEDTIVYLARELASARLVALRLRPASDAPGDRWLDVIRALDASLPSVDAPCPRCGKGVHGWGRFCGHCGTDLSGVGVGNGATHDTLLQAVKDAARHRYEILGQMDRAEGGGVVYFAREVANGRIVALRLQRDASAVGAEQYSIGVTQVLPSIVDSLGATYDPNAPAAPAAPRPTLPPDASHAGERTGPPPRSAPAHFVTAAAASAPAAPSPLPAPPNVPPTRRRWLGRQELVFAVAGALVVGVLFTAWSLRGRGGAYTASAGYGDAGGYSDSGASGKAAVSVASGTVATEAASASACATLFAALDWASALAPCRREAAAGDVAAQRALGAIFERGLGVAPNATLAATWYTKAAASGDRVAQFQLGAMHRDGRGVRHDHASANTWFRRSADQGYAPAAEALRRLERSH